MRKLGTVLGVLALVGCAAQPDPPPIAPVELRIQAEDQAETRYEQKLAEQKARQQKDEQQRQVAEEQQQEKQAQELAAQREQQAQELAAQAAADRQPVSQDSLKGLPDLEKKVHAAGVPVEHFTGTTRGELTAWFTRQRNRLKEKLVAQLAEIEKNELEKAMRKANECHEPVGTYRVHWEEQPNGTCGPWSDSIITWNRKLPKGTVTKCRWTRKHGIIDWNQDGSFGQGLTEISNRNCSSLYIVTWTKL
jgi:hypothetical protein